jgi:transposase
MAWTETTRRKHGRRSLGYASDCADQEWLIVESLLTRRSKVGRPLEHPLRDLWNAIQYIAARGCQWSELAKGLENIDHHF